MPACRLLRIPLLLLLPLKGYFTLFVGLSVSRIARKVVNECLMIVWRSVRCVTGNKMLDFHSGPDHDAET